MMTKLHPTLCATILAALATSSVCANSHIVDIAWSADARFEHRAWVQPGKFVELCGKLNVGDHVRWRFEASAAVDFNIHYHVGKDTEYPAKQTQVTTAQDALRVTVREDHCWMWTNKSQQPVRVDARLQR